jgi:phytoene dehydrogenase-like protein
MSENSHSQSSNYDAIIIGSGIGGLTVASLMTQILNKKVLILEKHSKFGGFSHSFGKKGKWRWDVGLHYVGDMHPKSMARKFFDFVTNNKLEWKSFPEPFQYYIYPDFKFAVSGNPRQFHSDLKKMFPKEKQAISQYLKDLKIVTDAWLILQLNDNNPIKKIVLGFSQKTKLLLSQTTKEYFEQNFHDQKLRALLDSQWGDTGLPSGKSPFYVHALVVSHYLRGAYYPKGGSNKIAEAILAIVKDQGGEAQSFAHVTELLFETDKNKVKGCRYTLKRNTPEGTSETIHEAYAPIVISNAGARITYSKWIPASVHSDLAQRIAQVPPGLTALSVFVGLKENPSILGIQGENFWIFSDYDHDKMAANCNQIVEGKPAMAFVSFGSSHNSEIQNSTAQIITFVEQKVFEKWQGTQFQNRGADYIELKNKMALTLIDFVETNIKGFRDLVEFVEVGTPLTVNHYTDQPYGEIYGLAGTPERYTTLKDLGVATPVENLYLTGADISMAGIVGALFGGAITFYKIIVGDILSFNTAKLVAYFLASKYKIDFFKLKKSYDSNLNK